MNLPCLLVPYELSDEALAQLCELLNDLVPWWETAADPLPRTSDRHPAHGRTSPRGRASPHGGDDGGIGTCRHECKGRGVRRTARPVRPGFAAGASVPSGRRHEGWTEVWRRAPDRGFIICAAGERMVKKSDVVERVAGEAGVTKRAAEDAVETVFAAIAGALVRAEDVTVAGFARFGSMSVSTAKRSG